MKLMTSTGSYRRTPSAPVANGRSPSTHLAKAAATAAAASSLRPAQTSYAQPRTSRNSMIELSATVRRLVSPRVPNGWGREQGRPDATEGDFKLCSRDQLPRGTERSKGDALRRVNLFLKGNLDVRDSLHSLRLNGKLEWNGVN